MSNNLKVTSFDYPVTMDIVNSRKKSSNDEMITENASIDANKKVGSVSYIGAEYMNNSRFIVEATAEKVLRETCFLNSLDAIFVNALPLDESFKSSKTEFLNKYFNKVLCEGVEISSFMEECSNKSTFLKKLVEACKKKASNSKKKVADEAIAKDKTSEKDIKDQVSNDDADLIAIDEYDVTEVSEIIKNKVTDVIQIEKENNDKDMAMVEEITNQKALGENVAVERIGLEEHTLFKSIMINNCKQTLAETAKRGESIEGYANLNESGEISLDMDTMLMEAVTEYTRLELFNTLKISNHSVSDMKTSCNKIAYQNGSMTY